METNEKKKRVERKKIIQTNNKKKRLSTESEVPIYWP